MADKKISQFDETLNPTLTAFLPIVEGSANQRVTVQTIIDKASTFVNANSASWVEPARNFDLVDSSSYCGVAVAGSSNSASAWKITKVTFANDGSVAFTGVASSVAWDDRLTATYL
jgi:hypothetical protein